VDVQIQNPAEKYFINVINVADGGVPATDTKGKSALLVVVFFINHKCGSGLFAKLYIVSTVLVKEALYTFLRFSHAC
jgi:hypothetical protein